MKNYDKYISKCIKYNYKGFTFFDKNFYKSFFLNRKIKLHYILKLKVKYDKIFTNDDTYNKLNNLRKKNFSRTVEYKILSYYKKFEINLILKRKYNQKFSKLTNLQTSFGSYVILGNLIYKCKNIDVYQKINLILKILDKILIKKQNIKKCNYCDLVNLILFEKKILNGIINEKKIFLNNK